MSCYLTIFFIAIVGVLFFKYVIIQRYSMKKALYYIISIVGMIMILLLLSNIYNFKLEKNLSTLLILLPFGLIITYCEKFFIKEVKPAAALQPISTKRSNSETREISQQAESVLQTKSEHETEPISELQPEPIPQNEPELKPELTPQQKLIMGNQKNSLQKEIRELLALCERIEDMNINESRFDPPAAEDEILNWERTNGITIPESYKEWLRFSNGSEIIGFTARLLGVKSMGASHDVFPGENPEDLVVIGHMGGCGDMLCFSKTTGKIVWLYDYRERDEFDSFKDVILKLIQSGKSKLG